MNSKPLNSRNHTPAKLLKRAALPGIIFLWTIASLSYESQWDFNLIFRYYGWVFTAQVAFLIYFLPKINWFQIKNSFLNKNQS